MRVLDRHRPLEWQPDRQGGAPPLVAVHRDAAAVRVHDRLGDGQPQPGPRDALPRRTGAAEEPLEDPVQVGHRDAHPGAADREYRLVAVLADPDLDPATPGVNLTALESRLPSSCAMRTGSTPELRTDVAVNTRSICLRSMTSVKRSAFSPCPFVTEQLDVADDRRQRGAQLMGHQGDELILEGIGFCGP
jgi:hypothetical protein